MVEIYARLRCLSSSSSNSCPNIWHYSKRARYQSFKALCFGNFLSGPFNTKGGPPIYWLFLKFMILTFVLSVRVLIVFILLILRLLLILVYLITGFYLLAFSLRFSTNKNKNLRFKYKITDLVTFNTLIRVIFINLIYCSPYYISKK